MREMPDVTIQDEGSIYILWMQNDEAMKWAMSNCCEPTFWGSTGLVVEHRYVEDILYGMADDGFIIGGMH